jgi:septum formation protein
MNTNLILASQSPRRRELLGFFRIPFEVKVADIDETMDPHVSPFSEVARISHKKALAIPRGAEDVVIAADTIVVCQGKVLGKPRTKAEAVQMLTMLSGRDHQVMTGLTVLRGNEERVCTEVTDLHFRELSQKEIEAYVATGEPMDKAGAYGIQGGAALFCSRMVGDYYNVMGLPVCRLWEILRELAPELMGEMV